MSAILNGNLILWRQGSEKGKVGELESEKKLGV